MGRVDDPVDEPRSRGSREAASGKAGAAREILSQSVDSRRARRKRHPSADERKDVAA